MTEPRPNEPARAPGASGGDAADVAADAAGDGTDGTDGSGESAGPRSRRKALASSLVGAALGGAAMFLVVRTLVSEWEEAEKAISDASWGWLAAAVVLAAAGMASIGVVWGQVLHRFGVSVATGRVVAWYFVGELGKYLPGGVWPVLGRGELARRAGVPRTRAYASVALSLGMLYLAAMFVATAFAPFAITGGGFSPWMLCLLALPLGVVALHHDVIGWTVDLIGRVTRRKVTVEVPRWRESLTLVAMYAPTWLFIGGATWAVARAITPDASAPRVVFAAVLSWVVGFLAVPVPAGAGVREAVLLAASGLDGGVAAATAIIARVIFVAVDAAGGLLGFPAAGRKRAGVRVGPLPGAVDDAIEPG
jgi:uncharacterized membrane protein YbhN (UPF0104 family)